MPKMKTHRASAKRFTATANGKFKRSKAYHRHILTSKDRKRKNRLAQPTLVDDADQAKVKRLLPYA